MPLRIVSNSTKSSILESKSAKMSLAFYLVKKLELRFVLLRGSILFMKGYKI